MLVEQGFRVEFDPVFDNVHVDSVLLHLLLLFFMPLLLLLLSLLLDLLKLFNLQRHLLLCLL